MPPRKASTPARYRPIPDPPTTLKRRHPLAESSIAPSPTSKSRTRRRGQNGDADEEKENATAEVVSGENGEGKDGEDVDESVQKEIEAWQDFAAEHYEMVEQLPLELHRNFRLLRELDEGCKAQTEKLHGLLRSYMTQRLAVVAQVSASLQGPVPQDSEISPLQHGGDMLTSTAVPPEDDKILSSEVMQDTIMADTIADPEQGEGSGRAEAMGIPLPDGHGGLLLPADPLQEQVGARLQFPSPKEKESSIPPRENGETDEQVIPAQETAEEVIPEAAVQPEASEVSKEERPNHIPHLLLPDIARLTREIVRSCEEKVAVAVGAYNAVDRHIRSLDSALETQETSLLIGLRPNTNPSTAVDDTIKVPAEEGGDGDLAVGIGGGGGRKRGKKGKKGNGGVVVVETTDLEPTFDFEADPNEPRYCYCHQVSYGHMIGCENEECPLEWFHLACCGLTSTPTGKWYCQICRPTPAGKDRLNVVNNTAVQNLTMSGVHGSSAIARKKKR